MNAIISCHIIHVEDAGVKSLYLQFCDTFLFSSTIWFTHACS